MSRLRAHQAGALTAARQLVSMALAGSASAPQTPALTCLSVDTACVPTPAGNAATTLDFNPTNETSIVASGGGLLPGRRGAWAVGWMPALRACVYVCAACTNTYTHTAVPPTRAPRCAAYAHAPCVRPHHIKPHALIHAPRHRLLHGTGGTGASRCGGRGSARARGLAKQQRARVVRSLFLPSRVLLDLGWEHGRHLLTVRTRLDSPAQAP